MLQVRVYWRIGGSYWVISLIHDSMFLLHGTLLPGMPGSQGGNPNPERPQTPTVATVFPPVLKDEKPSVHILRYMDGITKRIQKLSDFQLHISHECLKILAFICNLVKWISCWFCMGLFLMAAYITWKKNQSTYRTLRIWRPSTRLSLNQNELWLTLGLLADWGSGWRFRVPTPLDLTNTIAKSSGL